MPSPKKPSHHPAPEQREDDYPRRAQAMHRQYTAEFIAWWDSMSPEERKQAEATGIDGPLPDSSRVSGHGPGEDRDAAESPLAKVGFTYPTGAAAPAAPSDANPWLNQDTMLIMQRVIGMLISSENAKVAVLALAFAMNLDALNGLGSLREAALAIGLSPEAVSKKKREWERALDIPPNAFAKSPKAKLALSVAQQTKHWKKVNWKAPTKTCKQP